MNRTRLLSVLLATACCLMSLAGCQNQPQKTGALPDIHIEQKESLVFGRTGFIAQPQPDAFTICHGYTCKMISRLALAPAEWSQVSEFFSPRQDAAGEQQAIRQAIAKLEQITGRRVGTDQDKGRNLSGWGLSGQMDCIDESINTTVYLHMLQKAGLLRWHTLEARVSRGISSLQVPHFTAVIKNRQTLQRYAVDAWFLDNGEPPFLLPLDEWQSGWEPEA